MTLIAQRVVATAGQMQLLRLCNFGVYACGWVNDKHPSATRDRGRASCGSRGPRCVGGQRHARSPGPVSPATRQQTRGRAPTGIQRQAPGDCLDSQARLKVPGRMGRSGRRRSGCARRRWQGGLRIGQGARNLLAVSVPCCGTGFDALRGRLARGRIANDDARLRRRLRLRCNSRQNSDPSSDSACRDNGA